MPYDPEIGDYDECEEVKTIHDYIHDYMTLYACDACGATCYAVIGTECPDVCLFPKKGRKSDWVRVVGP
jgi:hypothetical protein